MSFGSTHFSNRLPKLQSNGSVKAGRIVALISQGIDIMDYFSRVVDREIDDLLCSLAAVSIEGPKGVGKTQTAKRFAKTVRELDDLAIQAIASADINQLLKGQMPILLDEWQRLDAQCLPVSELIQTFAQINILLFGHRGRACL